MRGARWVTSLGVGEVLRRFGVRAERSRAGLDGERDGGRVGWRLRRCLRGISPGREMFNRFETLWSAFVLKGTKHKVYFGADSGWWEGFAEIGAAYGPFDLTMLEIGAFDALWDAIHLGPDGAARAFAALGGKGLMMPIHWGLFDLALHAWRQPIERCWSWRGSEGLGCGLRSRGGRRRWWRGSRCGRIGGG